MLLFDNNKEYIQMKLSDCGASQKYFTSRQVSATLTYSFLSLGQELPLVCVEEALYSFCLT